MKSRCCNKELCRQNAITTAGGVVSGDIKLNVGSDLVRSLWCNDLTTGKKCTLLLGTDTNTLSYSFPHSQLRLPIKINSDGGFLILINQQPICDFGRYVILCSQPIDMDLHLIKNVKSLVNKLDAVKMAYVYGIKYKTATGIIPNIVMTDVGWTVGRWVDCYIKFNVHNAWPGFHKFSLMIFFNSSPASGWTRNFRLDYIELPFK